MIKRKVGPLLLFLGGTSLSLIALFAGDPVIQANAPVPLPVLPTDFSVDANASRISFEIDGASRPTNLDPFMQSHLTEFISSRHSPIAAVAVIEIKTGRILALAQGRKPNTWNSKEHSALFPGFPAASLFKTVVTAASFEVADLDAQTSFGLQGGCQHVRPSGLWIHDSIQNQSNAMTLRRAYGQSCNGFYAKLAINQLGLGSINEFAGRLGWDGGIKADFQVAKSPIRPPAAINSSTHGVGQYAAGFGYVGISAVHAAWMMAVIGNNGRDVPLSIFADTNWREDQPREILKPDTAARLMGVLDATVKGGTASFAFRRGKHRILRDIAGGKTGTLTGKHPAGLTTLFQGVMPLNDPEIAVGAVVGLDNLWFIKAPHLAAEAMWSYAEGKKQAERRTAVRLLDVSTPAN